MRAAALAALTTVLVLGCSDGGGDPQSLDDLVDKGLIGEEFAHDLSPEQAAVLEDGKVTFTEYEAAVFAHLECLEGRGLIIDGPTLDDDQVYRYAYGVPPGSTRDWDEIEDTAARCGAQHSATVEGFWQDTFRPGADGG